jgi:urocanate hydratase
MTARRIAVGAAAALCLAACSQAAAGAPTLMVQPARALLTIDQLADPGFTRYSPASQANALQLSGSTTAAAALQRDGFLSGATVRYTRQTEFAVADGPLDVISDVARFSAAAGAAKAFSTLAAAADAASGATAVSTGPLGDEGHADSIVRALPDGLEAVQLTVIWRVENDVNILVLRGRSGGTTLDDALVLAEAQTANELGGGSTPG